MNEKKAALTAAGVKALRSVATNGTVPASREMRDVLYDLVDKGLADITGLGRAELTDAGKAVLRAVKP